MSEFQLNQFSLILLQNIQSGIKWHTILCLTHTDTLTQLRSMGSIGVGLGRTTPTSSLPHSRADHSSMTSARTKPKTHTMNIKQESLSFVGRKLYVTCGFARGQRTSNIMLHWDVLSPKRQNIFTSSEISYI